MSLKEIFRTNNPNSDLPFRFTTKDQYIAGAQGSSTLVHPVGEARKTLSEVNFDWRLNLAFFGCDVSSDGDQQDAANNCCFGCACYHPLFVFNQIGDLARLLRIFPCGITICDLILS